MKKAPVVATVLVVVGGIYLQGRGNSRKVLADPMPASHLTNISAEKNRQQGTETGQHVGKPADSTSLVSQVDGTLPIAGTHPRRPHRVTLSWQPSENALTNGDIAGYNVYRCSGVIANCARINTDLVATPEYVDGQVRGGHTYYYATTAVNHAGSESRHSNVVKVVIPFP